MKQRWNETFYLDGTVEREFKGYVPCRQSVTKAALKLALENASLLDAVENLISQLPSRAPAVILWKDASTFQRGDALWNFFAPQLNLTPKDVDDIFDAAGQIDDVLSSKR